MQAITDSPAILARSWWGPRARQLTRWISYDNFHMAIRILKLLISLLVLCFDRATAAVASLLGRSPPGTCVVLYYHAIPAQAKDRFALQMDELARLSVPIDAASGEPLANGVRYSAVTFDDGFMSVVENALPELRERMIPCTIFVPTGSIGHHPSWIRPSHNDAGEIVATAEVLREIADSGLVRIGSHSATHPDFRRIDEERAKSELIESKATLEQILGREVTSFSFPHGAYTERDLALASRHGYSRVFTIDPVQFIDCEGRFAIGRTRVEPYDWPMEFRLKALGAYRWMSQASRLKRAVVGVARVGREKVARPPQGY